MLSIRHRMLLYAQVLLEQRSRAKLKDRIQFLRANPTSITEDDFVQWEDIDRRLLRGLLQEQPEVREEFDRHMSIDRFAPGSLFSVLPPGVSALRLWQGVQVELASHHHVPGVGRLLSWSHHATDVQRSPGHVQVDAHRNDLPRLGLVAATIVRQSLHQLTATRFRSNAPTI